MRLPIQRRLFLSHFLAVVLVSGGIGTLFYTNAFDSLMDSLRTRLMQSAGLLARAIDAHDLESLRTAADVDSDIYRQHLTMLRDFRAANPDIAFIYVMRRESDGAAPKRVVFVIDSDESPEQALPGEEYTESVPALLRGFETKSADEAITKDRWGYFLSGYAPLRNGDGSYLVGLDMRADEVGRKFRRLRVSALISLLLSVALAWGFSAVLARSITRPVRLLAARADAIAKGQLAGEVAVATGDEIETLAHNLNAMSSSLEESNARSRAALRDLEEARGGLEERVAERTARLAELNDELRREVDERTRAQEALAHAARTDYLTGLLNRRAMLELLEREVGRVERGGPPFAVAVADVDQFKRINDQHGHEVGDQVLIHIANLCVRTVRTQDAIARWGGEEFLVFLPATPLDGAVLAADKIRRALADQTHLIAGRSFDLRISLGVAAATKGISIQECIRRADEALYRAKANGRNRVEVAAGGS